MIAFVCNSPVQIVRAIHLHLRISGFTEPADIFVSDLFPGSTQLVDNLNTTGFFNSACLVNQSGIDSKKMHSIVFSNTFSSKNKYCKIVAFNAGSKLIDALYNLNKHTPGFEYHCVEDGPSIYKIPEYPDYAFYHPYRLLGLQHAYFHITNWWTSCPDFIDVPESYHTNKKYLPPIDYKDDELVNLINVVFGYKENKKLSEADVLIMDESHYQDNLMIDDADYKLYMRILERYPHAKFLMKMHPRTQHNRYVGKIDIMENSYIPWEVYVMNRARQNSRELIQISISCGTMFSDKLMFGYEGTKIFTAPLFYDSIKDTNDGAPRVSPEGTKKIERFRSTYNKPDQFVITYSEDELFATLDKRLNTSSN